jgi:hypothetical protein
MGTILYTRDGEGLFDHEGYVSHVLDDGTSAHGTWTIGIERCTVAWRAECTCGWNGTIHSSGGPNSPSDEEYDAVLNDWEIAHAGPLLRAAERARQLEALAETVRITEAQLREGIQEALARGATWTDIAAAIRTDVDKAQRLGGLLPGTIAAPESAAAPDFGLRDGPFAI